jgi:hypothetical protein
MGKTCERSGIGVAQELLEMLGGGNIFPCAPYPPGRR